MTQGNSMNYHILKAIKSWFRVLTSVLLHQVAWRKSCYSFSYRNLRNYLFINKFRFRANVFSKPLFKMLKNMKFCCKYGRESKFSGIFDEFIFYKFQLLQPQGRCLFLPHMMEFMMTDYTWNWRFRKHLCDQLVEMLDYCPLTESWKFISPLALTLLADRVSAVRLQALDLVSTMLLWQKCIQKLALRHCSKLTSGTQYAKLSHWMW